MNHPDYDTWKLDTPPSWDELDLCEECGELLTGVNCPVCSQADDQENLLWGNKNES